ncbi:hypothetical protein [Natranaerobius thermophilus]|nr:hypothetical protein [Natranaerobius thermophilus]
MQASLDTNVIIHLYKADMQSVLFKRFKNVVIYEFIRTHELERHADDEILSLFDQDCKQGRIEMIDDKYIRDNGLFKLFDNLVRDYRIIFDDCDLGEIYAISLAKILGCICLVTDDIKEKGPHYTLMREAESDVIPLAFYELLFIDYLDGKLTAENLLSHFNLVCEVSCLNIDIESKVKAFIRRFWTSPYDEAEKTWMKEYCDSNNINAKQKMKKLQKVIENN